MSLYTKFDISSFTDNITNIKMNIKKKEFNDDNKKKLDFNF